MFAALRILRIFLAVTLTFNLFAASEEKTNDPLLQSQWWLRSIGAIEAWPAKGDSNDITLVIIDSGVNCSHPDLKENCGGPHRSFTGDKNGDTDQISESYPFGHGTLSAGIVSGVGNNGLGISGVNWKAKFVSYKVSFSVSISQSVIAAYRALGQIPGKLVVIGNVTIPEGEAEISEVMRSLADRALFISSAGNEGGDKLWVPCRVIEKNNVCVGAYGNYPTLGEVLSYFSNYGEGVQIAAPGEEILTTSARGDYVFMSGTSASGPMTGGIAYFVWQNFRDLTPTQIKSAVLRGSKFNPWLHQLQDPRQANIPAALKAAGVISRGESLEVEKPLIAGVKNSAGNSAVVLGDALEIYGQNLDKTEFWFNECKIEVLHSSPTQTNILIPRNELCLREYSRVTAVRYGEASWTRVTVEVPKVDSDAVAVDSTLQEDGSYSILMKGLSFERQITCYLDFVEAECSSESLGGGMFSLHVSPKEVKAWKQAIISIGKNSEHKVLTVNLPQR